MSQDAKKPIVLLVLDGWGLGEPNEHNAIHMTPTPNYDGMIKHYPNTQLCTSGLGVGLPAGQMGNSEVGHVNLGAGKVVYHDFVRINKSIENGEFFSNPALVDLIEKVKASGGKLHTMGLTSSGGVHSSLDHLYAFMEMAAQRGIRQVYHHALMDGRDTPPTSGLGYLQEVEGEFEKMGIGRIATVMGRYYGMDRDLHWERIQQAYDCFTLGKGERAGSSLVAMNRSYAQRTTDEFMKPTVIVSDGKPVALINEGDGVFFFNFRPDRARQITRAFTTEGFDEFPRVISLNLAGWVCMTEYASDFNLPVAFHEDRPEITLGKVISELGMTQLRIAETEKYAHVTYFFNGGKEDIFKGEDRILVPSPRHVATYDEMPQMSGPEVLDKLVGAIEARQHDFILCNFANPDMLGHTGIMNAAQEAVAFIDEALGRIVKAVKKSEGTLAITADHGNCEKMYDPVTKSPHSAHTTNPVPLILVGAGDVELKEGALADITPTLLELMGIPKPAEMSGESLLG